MLGYGTSPTWFRYGMQQFGADIAPSGWYADPTASRSPMPSPHLERKLKEALGKDRKGMASIGLYAAAVPLAFVNTWISTGIYVFIALMWLVPDPRIESKLRD